MLKNFTSGAGGSDALFNFFKINCPVLAPRTYKVVRKFAAFVDISAYFADISFFLGLWLYVVKVVLIGYTRLFG